MFTVLSDNGYKINMFQIYFLLFLTIIFLRNHMKDKTLKKLPFVKKNVV